MTNKEKKQWLNRYKHAKNNAKRLKLEAQQAAQLSVSITQTITGMPNSSAKSASKIALAVECAEQATHQYALAEENARQIKQEIECAIDLFVDDATANLVLKYIYINLATWEQTAQLVTVKNGQEGCSLQTIWRKHNEGVNKLNLSFGVECYNAHEL